MDIENMELEQLKERENYLRKELFHDFCKNRKLQLS